MATSNSAATCRPLSIAAAHEDVPAAPSAQIATFQDTFLPINTSYINQNQHANHLQVSSSASNNNVGVNVSASNVQAYLAISRLNHQRQLAEAQDAHLRSLFGL